METKQFHWKRFNLFYYPFLRWSHTYFSIADEMLIIEIGRFAFVVELRYLFKR